jgi:hypothetical protein
MSTHNGLTEVAKGIDLKEIEGSYSAFAFTPDNQEALPVRGGIAAAQSSLSGAAFATSSTTSGASAGWAGMRQPAARDLPERWRVCRGSDKWNNIPIPMLYAPSPTRSGVLRPKAIFERAPHKLPFFEWRSRQCCISQQEQYFKQR